MEIAREYSNALRNKIFINAKLMKKQRKQQQKSLDELLELASINVCEQFHLIFTHTH